MAKLGQRFFTNRYTNVFFHGTRQGRGAGSTNCIAPVIAGLLGVHCLGLTVQLMCSCNEEELLGLHLDGMISSSKALLSLALNKRWLKM
jgi:hypothetical protein